MYFAVNSPLSTLFAVVAILRVESLLMGLEASLPVISKQQSYHIMVDAGTGQLLAFNSLYQVSTHRAPNRMSGALWQQYCCHKWATLIAVYFTLAICQEMPLSGIHEVGPFVWSCAQGAQADRPVKVACGVAHEEILQSS